MTEAVVDKVGLGGRRVRRYEMSDAVRHYLSAKYLAAGATASAGGAVSTALTQNCGLRISRDWRALDARLQPWAALPRNRAIPPVRSALGVAMRLAVLALTLVLLALIAAIPEAHADTVEVLESGMVVGHQAYNYSFDAPSGGILNVHLTDLDWPSPMSSLVMSVTSGSSAIKTLSGPGDVTFDIESSGTYYAHLMAQAAGLLDVGVFGLRIDFSPNVAPVPLPASLSLLLGGLGALAWSSRRRKKSVIDAA